MCMFVYLRLPTSVSGQQMGNSPPRRCSSSGVQHLLRSWLQSDGKANQCINTVPTKTVSNYSLSRHTQTLCYTVYGSYQQIPPSPGQQTYWQINSLKQSVVILSKYTLVVTKHWDKLATFRFSFVTETTTNLKADTESNFSVVAWLINYLVSQSEFECNTSILCAPQASSTVCQWIWFHSLTF